ncbi:MAG: DUF4097 domain-containing protein [Lachnospiraceae bacterium]|nr:DUF4097 domain-containing protein [Lachnospiraceae bacterium]
MRIQILLPLLLLFLLGGCGQKEKTQQNKNYNAHEISSIHIQNDSWQLALLASPDEDVHISAQSPDDETTIKQTDGILTIIQTDGPKNTLEQFSFSKKGKLSLSLPADMHCPISVENNSGDMEICNIACSDFLLDNSSGYGKFTNLTMDTAKINTASGDICIADSQITDIQMHSSSGYLFLDNPSVTNIELHAKSGEAEISQVEGNINLGISTQSGDITVSYQSPPDNLNFQIASNSKDISAKLQGAVYETDAPDCKQGTIGTGESHLNIQSDSGTVVIR